MLEFPLSFVAVFIALIFSEREHTFAVCCHPSVCRLSVTLVHQCTLLRRLKLWADFLRCLIPWPSTNMHGNFYGDRSRGTRPSQERYRVSKYSDFGLIEGYILETVQDMK